MLVGKIVEIHENQIYLSVFELFTAILPAEDINNKIFNVQGNGWVSKITKKMLDEGAMIQFKVKRFRFSKIEIK